MAMSVEDLRRREDDISVSDVTSLNTLVISDDETTVERIDTLATGDTGSTPSTLRHRGRARPSSAQASRAAPARAQVAVLLYLKNLTLREIGDILGVSESRVCQIHSQLERTLKRQLSEALLFPPSDKRPAPQGGRRPADNRGR